MATQEFDGKPCNIGTKNCRQPDQCPMSSIMHIRLKILIKTLAMLRNCKMHDNIQNLPKKFYNKYNFKKPTKTV